jgi:hypothetical protein
MADTILTVSGLTHIPSSTLADNIRVATNTTADDERKALFAAANARGLRGDEADTFVEKQIGKLNGWKENNGDGKYTIHLTRSATESTIVHEMGHIMRELLGNDADRLTEFESIYGKKGSTWVTDVVDNKDGTYSLGGLSFASYQAAYKKAVENEEKFANDFVRYMKEGVAPTEGLRDVFSRMKTILKGLLGIYAQDLDPAVRKAFEDLYAQNDREKAGGAGTGTLMESVEESDNPASFRENQETLAGFDGQIQKHDTGKKYKANEFYTAYAHTPLVYRELGYGDLPFVLFKSKVNQILAMPGEHVGTGTPHGDSVGIGTIREAVHGLSDPVAVFDSVDKDGYRRAGQFVVLVDVLDSKGKEVVVPLHMDMTAAHIAVDQIASVYGRPKNQIQNWASKGLLRYVDKRKASRSESMQVQFLGERQSLASGSSIITRDQIVKKYGTKGTLFEPAASQAEYGETEERLKIDPRILFQEAKKLSISDLKRMGVKKMFPIFADRTAAGVVFDSFKSVTIEPDYLLGGPKFPIIDEYFGKAAWANDDKTKRSGILKLAKQTDGYAMVVMMSDIAHRTNRTAMTNYLKIFDAYLKEGDRIPHDSVEAVYQSTRGMAPLADMPDFNDIEAFDDWLWNKSTFEERRHLMSAFAKPSNQALGLPPMDLYLKNLMEKDFNIPSLNYGDGLVILKIDTKNIDITLGEEGTVPHPSYSTGIRGEVVGVLEKPLGMNILFEEFMRDVKKKSGPMSPADYRAATLKNPVFSITDSMVELEKTGKYKYIRGGKHADAMLSAFIDEWATSDTKKKDGGVGAAEFLAAMRNNPGASSLTPTTLKNLSKSLKSKKEKLYQLTGHDIYFALKRERQWYQDALPVT